MEQQGSAAPKSGIFGLEHSPDEASVVLVPVPWEATTSYGRGTAEGPGAILTASAQVDLFDVDLGDPSAAGVAMLEIDPSVRANAEEAARRAQVVIEAFDSGKPVAARDGDLRRVNELSAWLDDWLDAQVSGLLERGKIVGVVGGDHSVVYGAIAAHARRFPGLGILHVDAHADLREAYQGFVGSHASIMHRVMEDLAGVERLVSVGLRDISREEHQVVAGSEGRIVAHFDAVLARRRHEGACWTNLCEGIVKDLPEQVYLSFDIDGLDPALCPGTGTPVPGGLSFHQAITLLHSVLQSGRRIVGFDLCEVAPGDDEWDANVGARVLYKLLGYALASQDGTGKTK